MKETSNRIRSIDLLRGFVMMLMALDHVRDFFHNNTIHDPLDLQTTTPILFFSRWITHFCAPVFIFLSGTSAYLSGIKKTKMQLSKFLILRGFWLIIVEFAIVSLGWSFNLFYNTIVFQVIAAIGTSMIILGLMIWMPYIIILLSGISIICFHNLVDSFEIVRNGNVGFLWDLLHHGGFNRYEFLPHHSILIIYPFVPWAGLMMLGYCFGKIFSQENQKQKRFLLITGMTMIVLFIIFRFVNNYGDHNHWSVQKDFIFTILSFIDVSKYPPSFLYVLITIGPALIFLSITNNIKNKIVEIISVFGRVPFFYYIVHIYLIHILTLSLFFISGHTIAENSTTNSMINFRLPGMGFNLFGVYLVWIFVLVVLYFPCRWYDNYKRKNKKWWLSYL